MTAEDLRRERLHRLRTIYVRSPIYFVTACTRQRKTTLANAAIHESLLEYGQAGADSGIWIGAYVVMPDHIHLFVAMDEQRKTLPGLVKSLKNTLSKALRAIGISSPHWQKGFFDHVLRSGESYSQKWEYVRNNPVRAGLVVKPEDWRYAGEIFSLEYLSDR